MDLMEQEAMNAEECGMAGNRGSLGRGKYH